MKWITATDLDRWATTVASRYALSDLISALVRGTASDIKAFRFPTGDSAQQPGYDGVLEATEVKPFIPGGFSVWEFGTNEKPAAKATKDYMRRSAKPGTVDPSKTTFVFVTPRTWSNSAKWVASRTNAKKKWADVRVIDGVMLEAWLEQTPAVAAEFATRTLEILPPEGVVSANSFWEEYAYRTNPPLTEKVLLAGRDEESKRLIQLLVGQAQDIVIQADSRDEALAFALSAIRSAEPGARKFIDSKTIIVESDEVARRLANRSGLVVGVRSTAASMSGLLVQRGNFVVLPLGNDSPNQPRITIRLSRPARGVFASALETMGMNGEVAESLARECGRSVTVLQRRMPSVGFSNPGWVSQDSARKVLIVALLAGSWDSASEHDRAIIELLAQESYEDFEKELLPLLHVADTPVERLGTVWNLVAPVDCFELLAPYISPKDLGAFRKAATETLSEIDPSLEMAPDERPYAGLSGQTLKRTKWLRDGLTNTILLIAVRGDAAKLTCHGGCQSFVDSLIKGLPGLAADHRLLASLRGQLPMLMEAAPDPLLSTLEHLLEGDGRSIAGIFSESEFLGPSSPHTGLLWALELLAWSPLYLERVSLILAKLARIDPGGRLMNRPINSLREIFLLWHPGTNASFAARMRVLDRLLEREPKIGWELLVKLLPRDHDTSSPTNRPLWRDDGASEYEEATWQIVIQGAREVTRRVIERVGSDPGRLRNLLELVHTLAPEDRPSVYDLLDQFATRNPSASDRLFIWAALRDEVNRHKRFEDADWALTKSEVERLDSILDGLKPADIVELHKWLFDEYFPDLPGVPVERMQEEADSVRRSAVLEVYQFEGLDGILRLAKNVRMPGLVGAAAASVLDNLSAVTTLLDRALSIGEKLDSFSIALSGQSLRVRGDDWREYVIRHADEAAWSTSWVATCMLGWPDDTTTWHKVASLGAEVERLYWSRKAAFPLKGPADVLAWAAMKYIAVGRACAAMDALRRRVTELPGELVLTLLDQSLEEINRAGKSPQNHFIYQLDETFDALSKRQDIPALEIARREYAFLPLLVHRKRPLTLHRLLAEEPEFFVQVLCDVYKPASGKEEVAATEEHKTRATFGYRLLESWETVPGVSDDLSIDSEKLRSWVTRARAIAAERDRASVADVEIGKLLAHAPKDPNDGAWPHRAVRDLLEDISAADVERGISVEQFNKRGVYSKAMFEGGDQERALAASAHSWAMASTAWPRTARLLAGIAKNWERHAKAEDVRAEQDKARLS